MSALGSVPAPLRRAFLLGLLGLAVTVPFSAPDGTGMQWDELVLGSVAATASWTVFRRLRAMDRAAARPWYAPAAGMALFAVAQLLAGLFPGPEFDGFGADDVLLFVGATSPLVTCAMLARRVSRTRWPALILDGLVVTVALLVVTEILRDPLADPANAPEDLRSLVLAYGGYAAVMLGGAGAMCTVSTRALRAAATTLIGAVTCQATAAAVEAVAIVWPSPGWTAVSDVAVATALLGSALAAHHAPLRSADRGPRASAPVVSPLGLVLVIGALLSLPLAIVAMELAGRGHSAAAEIGMGLVFALMAARLVLRIREDGKVTEDLVRSEEDFRELIEASSDGIAIMDGEFALQFTSPAARRLLGIPDPDAAVRLLDLVAPEDRELVRTATAECPAGEGHPLHVRVPTGGAVRELEITSSERPGSGRRVLYLRDVTTRRQRERELERMAYTDHLTALPNRALLFQEMATAAGPRCLLVLDLDGFKAVNDVAGHEAGDQLLVEVARRLDTVVRGDDLVARLGGDEFAVLVSGTLAEAEEVAQRVVDIMTKPHRTGDWTFAVGASVGVARLGAAGGQVAFREADAALRAAKQAGKGCVRLAHEAPATAGVRGDEADAIVAEGTMTVRFDTAVAPSGEVVMVHALPVWTHPSRGTLRGLELWGAAERLGRAERMQRWLIRSACTEAAALPGDTVCVAVSLPAGHVTPDGLADHVAATLAATGLPATRFALSFTEETLLTSSAALLPELEEIRRTGVRLVLDNYGMGHSLFALLARIPLDCVRVDLNALAARDDAGRALQVLAAIVRTTSGFDLDVIAGGISSEQLREAAVDTGVTLLHGRALPHDLGTADLARLLTAVPTS